MQHATFDPQPADSPLHDPAIVAAAAGPAGAAPAPQMRPPRAGLLVSANFPDEPRRWQAGVRYQPEGCGAGGGVVVQCGPASKTTSGGAATRDWEPYGVWDFYRCSTFGSTVEEAEARARRRLEACESRHLERELWRGNLARSASLADGEQLYLTSLAGQILGGGAAQTAADALACLEEGLAGCGCGQRAMIHATRATVTHWAAQQLVRREGNLMLTINDTIVVAGAGYDGSGPPGIEDGEPTAAASGAVWAYATGMVEVRRDPIRMVGQPEEWINRDTNLLEARAERLALASWDGCCHFQVKINHPLCSVGGS